MQTYIFFIRKNKLTQLNRENNKAFLPQNKHLSFFKFILLSRKVMKIKAVFFSSRSLKTFKMNALKCFETAYLLFRLIFITLLHLRLPIYRAEHYLDQYILLAKYMYQ